MRRALLALVATIALAPVSQAHAHGRPPTVEAIALDPNDPGHVVLSATFGLLVSRDGGASWRWTCAAGFGADPTQEEPDVLVAGDGSILVTTFDGIVRGEPDLCDYTFPEGLARDVFVPDVAPDPTDARTVWALTSSGATADRVIRSTDGGRTWVAVGAPIEDILTERILVAPSDPSRVYVSGAIPPAGDVPRQAFLLRSDDGGESFTAVEIELVNGERLPHVVGVDPTNADRVWVRMARGEVDPRDERLLYSDDGGRTFTTVLELSTMRGFAISPDGRTVWAGSSVGDGLWVARDGTMDFELLAELDVRCLAAREGELWLCVDQITEGFALGRSTDGGVTIDEVLRFQEAEMLIECPRCSASGVICPAWLPDLRADFATYLGGVDAGMTGLPRDAGIPEECRSPDAGTAEPGGSSGCGCRAAGTPGHPPAALVVIAIVGVLTGLRRGSRSAGRSGTPRR